MAQRNTWQRDRVREALGETSGFVSAQSLHAMLREENTGIGLATVYRALAGLAAQGDADSLQSPEGESLYRLPDSDPRKPMVMAYLWLGALQETLVETMMP